MKGIREYVSPDNQHRFVVVYDEQDISLGFEGFPWHTSRRCGAAAYEADITLVVQFLPQLVPEFFASAPLEQLV